MDTKMLTLEKFEEAAEEVKKAKNCCKKCLLPIKIIPVDFYNFPDKKIQLENILYFAVFSNLLRILFIYFFLCSVVYADFTGKQKSFL